MRESLGLQALGHNESEGGFGPLRWELRRTIDRSGYSLKDLSKSVFVRTRKMVIYA